MRDTISGIATFIVHTFRCVLFCLYQTKMRQMDTESYSSGVSVSSFSSNETTAEIVKIG